MYSVLNVDADPMKREARTLMARAVALSSLLKLASHDSHLLGFFTETVALERLNDNLQISGRASLGSLPEDYFYLISRFATIVLAKPRMPNPQVIEVAQNLRIQLIIGIQENRYVYPSFDYSTMMFDFSGLWPLSIS